ncbi:MAG: hypothetical protein ABFD13_03950 [Candidatus Cryosericum sp.]|nr:hypothetical protein [bacterium]
MNRKRMRTWVIVLVVLALISGSIVTLVSALHGTTVDTPITVLPGVTLTPEDLNAVGLGTAVDVQYADKTFLFFPDAQGKELASAKSGLTITFRNGSVTFLGGQFSQVGGSALRDQAYASYKNKVQDTGLSDDRGAAVIGDASARFADPAAAALIVRKNETVFTLLYTLNAAADTGSPEPIVALDALARLLAERF